MEILWPDSDPHAAAGNYRQVVHAARRALESTTDSTIDLAPILHVRGGTIRFEPPGSLWIDAEVFMNAALAARQSEDPSQIGDALELFKGELLPESPFEEWLMDRQVALHETAVGLLNKLARIYERDGDLRQAIDALQRLLTIEPAHEAASATLMRLYALSGQPALADRQYRILRHALRTYLDAEPSQESEQLHEDISSGRLGPGLVLPLEPTSGELPTHLTTFVGREREIEEVTTLLDRNRIVTLTGAGGCGKSRLALAVAERVQLRLPSGTHFVELESIRDPAIIARTILVVLGITEVPSRSPLEMLAAALRDRPTLLVLDNCEHLIDACGELVGQLLERCRLLRVLATSREPMRLPGEAIFRVPSLPLPTPEDLSEPERAMNSEAIQLFVDRATRRTPDFTITERNIAAVAEICARLDGIPLAIELAAAHIGFLSLEDLAERLNDTVRFLRSSERTTPARHQTLRATLDWSYQLLDEQERKALRRLAVFSGGWTISGAESVVADEDTPPKTVIHFLSSLANRSLIEMEDSRIGIRYRLLDTVRQYAWERLEKADETEYLKRVHAEYFASVADTTEAALRGPDQALWLDRLAMEIDNMRSALAFARDRRAAKLGLRICWGLWRFWNARGYLEEGRDWMKEILSLPHQPTDDVLRVGVLFAASRFAMLQSDFGEAKALATECSETALRIGDLDNLSGAFTVLGHVELRGGRLTSARQAYQNGLEVRRELGDDWGVAISTMSLARVAQAEGANAEGVELYDAARTLFLNLGDTENAAFSLYRRASIALELGDLTVAEQLLDDALVEMEVIGNRLHLSECLIYMGRVAIEQGKLDRAHELLSRALSLAYDVRSFDDVANGLEGFALLAAVQGRSRRYLTLSAAASRLREAIGEPKLRTEPSRLQAVLDSAQKSVGPSERQAAIERGRWLRLDRAVELALSANDV